MTAGMAKKKLVHYVYAQDFKRSRCGWVEDGPYAQNAELVKLTPWRSLAKQFKTFTDALEFIAQNGLDASIEAKRGGPTTAMVVQVDLAQRAPWDATRGDGTTPVK